MMKLLPLTIAAIAFAAAPTLAQAQEEQAVTLQAQGNVMVSDGGEFTTAQSGTQLAPGNRVMVGEGGSVQLVYPNACQTAFTKPGVYTVAPVCTPVAVATAATTDLASAAILAGAALVGAAGLNSMDEVEAVVPPPASR